MRDSTKPSENTLGEGESRPPRRPGRPTQAETAALTELILNAAEDSFITRGFADTTIQQLSEDCGVTRRSIVARFKTTDALLIAIYLRDVGAYSPSLAAYTIRESHLWEDLEALVRKLAERGADKRQAALLRAYLGEVVRLPELAQHILEFYRELSTIVEAKISVAQGFGLFRGFKASTVAANAIALLISNARIRTMILDPDFNDPVLVERYFTDAWLLIRAMA
ncbi:MAG: TetR/AcrR family transcriptional regulator [Rhodobacteraceae bacterium]|nr:TetR/AcrR family transcriptional regulator [Paracoccaceae bacterium]